MKTHSRTADELESVRDLLLIVDRRQKRENKKIIRALLELSSLLLRYLNYYEQEKKRMNTALATLKDRIAHMKEQGAVDWPTILDALETLTDSLIASQMHGPPLPPADHTPSEAHSEETANDTEATT